MPSTQAHAMAAPTLHNGSPKRPFGLGALSVGAPREVAWDRLPDEPSAAAASVLRQCDGVILVSGHGMGKHSKLDKLSVLCPAASLVGMAWHEAMDPKLHNPLCEPDVRLAWGCHASTMEACATANIPKFYRSVLRIAQGRPSGCWALTTAPDGLWERAGLPESRMVEAGGSWRYLQCAMPCRDEVWRADPEFAASMLAQSLPLKVGDPVEVRRKHHYQWHEAEVINHKGRLACYAGGDVKDVCDWEDGVQQWAAVRRPGAASDDLIRVPNGIPLPKCKHCDDRCGVRANVSLFGERQAAPPDPRPSTPRFETEEKKVALPEGPSQRKTRFATVRADSQWMALQGWADSMPAQGKKLAIVVMEPDVDQEATRLWIQDLAVSTMAKVILLGPCEKWVPNDRYIEVPGDMESAVSEISMHL